VILAAAAEHFGAGGDGGFPVEDDRVVVGADGDAVAGVGAGFEEASLDAEAARAVGEVADGLVVGEVGLADPAFGLPRRGRGRGRRPRGRR